MKRTIIVAHWAVIVALSAAFGVTYSAQSNEIAHLKSRIATQQTVVKKQQDDVVTEPVTDHRETTPQKKDPAALPLVQPAAHQPVAAVQYSPFVLAYSCGNVDAVSCSGGPRMSYRFNVDSSGVQRDIVLRKVVVDVKGLVPGGVLHLLTSPAQNPRGGRDYSLKMNQTGPEEWSVTWSDMEGLSSTTAIPMPESVEIDAPGVLAGNTAVVTADFSKWQAWDHTSEQPVRIVQGTP